MPVNTVLLSSLLSCQPLANCVAHTTPGAHIPGSVCASMQVYAWTHVVGSCQPTSALLPSLRFSVSSGQGGHEGGVVNGSGQRAGQRPWAGKATAAYGFSGELPGVHVVIVQRYDRKKKLGPWLRAT